MLSSEAKQRLRKELERFGRQLQRSGLDHREEARRLFQELQLEGAIQALTPLEYRHERLLELAARAEPDDGPVYAIDGGSTRLQRLENGTILCAYQAVLASDPDTRLDGLPLEAHRSLSLVSHSQRLDVGGSKAERLEDGYVHFWRVHLSRAHLSMSTREIDQVVSGLARVGAESYHALRMLQLLGSPKGLWLLDGPLYPIGLYYYFAGEPEDDVPFKGPTWTDWPPAVEILVQPLRLVEACVERDLPLLGLNKNPQTAWLLEFTLGRDDRNWSSDAQFIKAVLSETPKDALGYTNWFVQEEYSLPRRGSELERESFDLFEHLEPRFGLQLPRRAYHVCFFYVYDPRVRAVLKVEAPRAVVEAHGPERLQSKLLADIARGTGVPPAIRRADSRARITEEERLGLIRACGLEIDFSYDQSRGEPI
jgi:hypothetical protein